MTIAQADALIAQQKPLDLFSELLVGYERISADVTQNDTVGRIAIAKMILDCNGTYGTRKIPFKLSTDKQGRISFWTLPPDIEPR